MSFEAYQFCASTDLQHNRHTYTVQMMKPGNSEASVNFTLSVYDSIRDVSLGTGVQDAVEGGAAYELFYSSAPGQAASSEWYFNGLPLADSSRYAITDKSLTIKRPSRNDTGRYGVVLTNPFSSGKQYKDVTVFYGPDQPFLEVSPTKATFVAGETLSLSCRAEGVPAPSATWVYNGHSLPTSPNGTLQLTDVQPSQSGFYTCMLVNVKTSAHLERDVTIEVRGLSTAAIVGLAAGIPCGLLLLILLAGLVLLCVFCYKKKDRNPRYPVSRAVEKAVVSQPDMTKPHKLLISGLKQPPDYRLYDHQGITERAGSLPLATHPMRMATTV
ncbi:cell adhesion molecule CEACAM6 isoform X2 [Brachyhypopomus gauderio]|uniref:cell adhesion molecule CEACAM6 isoform X2 n=1 Tax=Brachyhypopomus gauderio TaxID=698409 RepID=UPI0040420A92